MTDEEKITTKTKKSSKKSAPEFGFVKLRSDAVIPEKDFPEDAAYPLTTLESFRLLPGQFKAFRTGLAPMLQPGYYYDVRPRSGMAIKFGVTVINTPGLIDSNYTGEIMVGLVNFGKGIYAVEEGDRIAQIMLKKCEDIELVECEAVRSTDRGSSGIGSTGR